MHGGRYVRAFLAAAIVAVIVAPTAMGASPREIHADFADNGRLDRQYSVEDLRRALQDAEQQGYPNAGTTPPKVAIEKQLRDRGVDRVGRSDGTLPFTGVDLALLSAGAGILLVLGWGFRRYGRPRS